MNVANLDPEACYRIGLFIHSIQASGRDILEGVADQMPSGNRVEYHIPFPLDRPFYEHRWDDLDGMIVRIDRPDDPSIAVGEGRPRVLIAAGPIEGVAIDLMWDNPSAGRLAAHHFIELGYRHYAFVGRLVWSYQMDRLNGYCQVLEDECRDAPNILNVEGRQESHSECLQMIADWLPTLEPGTAILAATDPLGQDVLAGTRAAGISVPEELALVTIGNDRIFCEMSGPPLSAVTLPGRALGRAAAQLLSERLASGSGECGLGRCVAACELEQRRSSDLVRVNDGPVAKAISLIRARATAGLTVPEVHDAVPLSRRALELRFKKQLGRTMQQEICRVQIAEAKRLLTNTNLTMMEVAIDAGFPNAQRLSVVFAREVGRPPIEYRRVTQQGLVGSRLNSQGGIGG